LAEAATTRPAGEQWLPVVLSVGVHALLVAVLGWGWWSFKRPLPAPRQLAIEATVIQEMSTAASPAPESGIPAPPVPPPADNSAELERQAREQAAAEAQKVHEAEQARQAEEAKREEARRQEARQADAQKQREAEERRQAQAEAKARHDAEQKRLADRKRQADEAARKAHDAEERAAQERARRESDLRAQLASEERINAARGSADAAAYRSMIQARIQRNWIRPAGAQHGVNCEVRVTQVPGGEVTGVQITRCNGDAALRESIEAAVYRASPLPVPTNADLFDRNLVLTFHPDD